jgi:hypothetical protein
MFLRRSLSAMILALSLAPAVAWAEPTDADRATARTLAVEGQEAFDRKDFTTAADRFSRADSLIHAPTLMLALARSQAGLGKLVTAQELCNRIVREGVAPKSPPSWGKALEDAKREADALAARIPTVTISVNGASNPRVTLDGAPVSSAALGAKRPVDPGKHTIRAEATGFAAVETKLTLVEGKNEPVVLELKSAPSAEAPPEAPKLSGDLPPAPVAELDTVAPKWSTQKTIGMVALGVGGAGLVLGAVTGGLAIGKHGTLEAACGDGHCAPSEQSTLDSYHLLSTLSTAGFVIGGAGAAAGVILLLTAPRAQPVKAAKLTPVIGLGYLGAEGTF